MLLYLRHEYPRQTLRLYFNVPGGHLQPALAIYDLLHQTKQRGSTIETVNLGMAGGVGALLCASGTVGHRYALPNSRFLLQRPGIGDTFRGQATDIALVVKDIKKLNSRVVNELASLTGQPVERVQEDMKRDFYLFADQALDYGLIDDVILPNRLKRGAMNERFQPGQVTGPSNRYIRYDSGLQ